MNPWFGKAAYLIGMFSMMVIRAPHGRRSRQMRVHESRKGRMEVALLGLMWIGTLVLPLISIVTSLLSFADYVQGMVQLLAGVACLALGLWLFYRSHADLGTNWSVTLQIREKHQLVTRGVYQRVRHPMYTAIFLFAVAQALLLPNWIAGPSCLLAFLLMFAFRLRPEEKMMLERFGASYAAYMKRTKRLIPKVW